MNAYQLNYIIQNSISRVVKACIHCNTKFKWVKTKMDACEMCMGNIKLCISCFRTFLPTHAYVDICSACVQHL